MWLFALLCCAASSESAIPAPPAPAPTPEVSVNKRVFVDLTYGESVDVPALKASVTLVEVVQERVLDPETGERYDRAVGTIRVSDGERTEELSFGQGEPLSWDGRAMSLRGADLSWQLIIAP